jgi:hypothetical protein
VSPYVGPRSFGVHGVFCPRLELDRIHASQRTLHESFKVALQAWVRAGERTKVVAVGAKE